MLHGHHAGRAHAALGALKALSLDDSRKVANAATEALKAYERERPSNVETDLIEPALGHREVKDVAAPRPTVAPTDDRRITGATTAAKDERREIPPSDIFISYEHRDRDKARVLANALAAAGWTVWWDRRIAPGEAFDLVIERELASCKCVIVLWTARSVGATWVRNEARRAAKRRVLVPILIWVIYLLYRGLPIMLGTGPERGMLMASALVAYLLVAWVSLIGITTALWRFGLGPVMGI